MADPPNIDQRLRPKSLDGLESVAFIIATSGKKQPDQRDPSSGETAVSV